MTTAAIAAALVASLCYALCAAVQQRQAAATVGDRLLHPGLLLELLRRPLWLAAFAAGALGEALHVVALAWAPLAVVQPLGVTIVLFALVLSAAFARRRPRLGELIPAAIMVAGLAALLSGLRTSDAPPATGTPGLIAIGCITAAGLGVLTLGALRSSGAIRTLLLGCGAGAAFGVTAALASVLTHRVIGHGPAGLLGWTTPMVIATAIAGVLLEQAAYKSGRLGIAAAGMTVADPLVAILVGAAALHQPAHVAHPLAAAVEIAAIVVGVVLLTRGAATSRDPVAAATVPPGQRCTVPPSTSATGSPRTMTAQSPWAPMTDRASELAGAR